MKSLFNSAAKWHHFRAKSYWNVCNTPYQYYLGYVMNRNQFKNCFLAPPAERQRSFSNAELSVVRLSVYLSVRPSRLK